MYVANCGNSEKISSHCVGIVIPENIIKLLRMILKKISEEYLHKPTGITAKIREERKRLLAVVLDAIAHIPTMPMSEGSEHEVIDTCDIYKTLEKIRKSF